MKWTGHVGTKTFKSYLSFIVQAVIGGNEPWGFVPCMASKTNHSGFN